MLYNYLNVRRITDQLRYLRLRPFQQDTEKGRNDERYRRAALSFFGNVAAKAISLGVVFESLNVALPYLGRERFGIWMTIYSMVAAQAVLDLGIGNALISRVAAAAIASDKEALAKLISGSLRLLVLVGVVAGIFFSMAAGFAPLSWLFREVSEPALQEARESLIVFALLFALSLPLQAVHRVLVGLQCAYLSHIAIGCCGLLSCVILPFLPKLNAGIPEFLLATYGVQVLSGLALAVYLFRRKMLRVRDVPSISDPQIKGMISTSGLFFFLQIAGIIAWSGDSILLSSMIGPDAVAIYAVTQRIFMIISMPLAMLNAPLWAGYADAYARADRIFIRRTLVRSVSATLIGAVLGGIGIMLFFDPLETWLTHGSTLIPKAFVCGFAIWTILDSTGNSVAMYLNGVHVVRPQVIIGVFFIGLCLTLKLILLPAFGIVALPFISAFSYLVTDVLLYATIFRSEILRPILVGAPISECALRQ